MGAVKAPSDRDVEDLNQARNALDRALIMFSALDRALIMFSNSRSLTLDDVELALKLLTGIRKRLAP